MRMRYRIKTRMIHNDLVYDVQTRSWCTLYMWVDSYTTCSLSGANYYMKQLINIQKFTPEIYYPNKDGGLDEK